MSIVTLGWCGCVRPNEPFCLELSPHLRRNRVVQPLDALARLLRCAKATDDAAHDRVGQLRENGLFLSFPYIGPEPVLVK
jgi:hypothetical protein